jgi:hypothetical protein
MKTVVIAFLVAFAHAAEYPKAVLKDNCAATHPCDAQIWLQLDADHPAFQATHNPRGTDLAAPAISPDGRTIVYGLRKLIDPDHLSPLHIVFLDWSGQELRRIDKVPTDELESPCGYGSIEWIDSARLGVKCEYNPSAENYVILDVGSGKVLKQYMGLYFSWSPDRRTLAHVALIMHFARPPAQNHCLHFNEKAVYTPNCTSQVEPLRKNPRSPKSPDRYPNIHTIYSPLAWSLDGSKVAFVVSVYDLVWNEPSKEDDDFVNSRQYLAIVPLSGRAVGYKLTGSVGAYPQLSWLDGTRIDLKSKPNEGGYHRTFDLAADSPQPIP